MSRLPARKPLYYLVGRGESDQPSPASAPASATYPLSQSAPEDFPPSALRRPLPHRRLLQLTSEAAGTPWRLSSDDPGAIPARATGPAPPRRPFNPERALGLIRHDHPSRKWPSYEDPYPHHHLHERSWALTGDSPLPFDLRPEFQMPPPEPRLNDPEENQPKPCLEPKWRKLLAMTKGEGRTEEVMRRAELERAMGTAIGKLEETSEVLEAPAKCDTAEEEEEKDEDDHISEMDPAELLGLSWEDADFIHTRMLRLYGNIAM